MFRLEELTGSFKKDEKGFYLETSTAVKYNQQEDARKAGYSVKDTGTQMTATGKFYANLPEEIDLTGLLDFLAANGSKDAEKDILTSFFKDYALLLHGRNRAIMQTAIDKKVPKDNEVILGFLAKIGVDVESLTFEQKCDKSYLEGLITLR